MNKKDHGSSGVCRADRTNVGRRAFGAQAGMLRYVVLNACNNLPKNAIRNQNLLKMLQITKICQRLPLVAKNTQKWPKVSKSCLKLPLVAKSNQKEPKVAKICQKLPKVAKSCQK